MKDKKTRLSNILINILFVLIGLFFVVMLGNLLLNKYDFIKINYICYFIVLTVFLVVYIILNKYSDKLFSNKFINIGFLILYFIFQVWFIKEFMVTPSWDFGDVFEAAARFAIDSVDLNESSYLYLCDNNIPLAVIEGYLFKFCVNIFGLVYNDLIYVGLTLNLLCVDISLFFLYKTLNNINGKMSKTFFLFCLFMSPFITYLPIFYTDTLTLPFVSISIYFIYKYLYKEITIFETIICGMSLGIGGILKPTVLIILIAFIIFVLLKYSLKENLKFILILFLLVSLTILGNKIYKSVNFDQDALLDNRLVLEHYLMVGMGDEHNGAYSEEYFHLSTNIVGEAQKKYFIRGKIKERIDELLNTHTFVSFYNRKNSFTWTNGSFYAPESLYSSQSKLVEYISSNKGNDLVYWSICNVQWSLIIALIAVGCMFKKHLPKEMFEFKALLDISIFGLVLFLFIWEASSRYLINFMPIFLIDAFIGINSIYSYLINTDK